MEWLSSVLTLIGVALGVTATLAADHLRWQREASRQRVLDLRQLYGEYLSNLHQAGEALWALAQGDDRTLTAGRELAARAREVFRAAGLYASLERIMIGAPAPVQGAANDAFHAMRDVRDRVAEGLLYGTPEHRDAEKAWELRRRDLRTAMRADLERLDRS
ncbi:MULTISPECIES: hypothetical protein [unclassified Streptomyces]|uniref:hypothetical protein n=1 Tax=unclassified Streptomyces TaxID=2593676 RepID=UPI002E817AAE|nr:hypothetical protein [Streptomyces sp. NBC_00589]WTI42349.1 hypothetical protein OIC96_49365 [Streptomyces sp. NBC_00775]WUB23969.1 hypothetical protein OHA51_00365 [Streptomyces sp. NBC_00589]